jgi:uncharacterized protein (DUF305 family)
MKRILTLTAVILAVAALAFGSFARPAPVGAQSLEQLTGEEFEKAFLRQMIMHHMMAVMMAQPIPDKAIHDELKEVGRTIIRTQSAEVEQMSRWLKDWYGIDAMPMHGAMMGQGGMAGGQGGMMPEMGQGQGMTPGQGMGGMHGGMTQGGPGTGQGMQGDQGMSGMHQGMGMEMMGMLTGLQGPRLEATFMSLMIPHHEGAISMARLAVDRAVHDELRDMAKQIVEDQSIEVRQFNEWLAAWYGL